MANTTHAFCEGLPLTFFQKAPGLKGKLTGSKGEWVTLADYVSAQAEFSKFHQVIALFSMIESLIPKPEIIKVEPIQVEVVKLIKSVKRNHADRSAASQKKAA